MWVGNDIMEVSYSGSEDSHSILKPFDLHHSEEEKTTNTEDTFL